MKQRILFSLLLLFGTFQSGYGHWIELDLILSNAKTTFQLVSLFNSIKSTNEVCDEESEDTDQMDKMIKPILDQINVLRKAMVDSKIKRSELEKQVQSLHLIVKKVLTELGRLDPEDQRAKIILERVEDLNRQMDLLGKGRSKTVILDESVVEKRFRGSEIYQKSLGWQSLIDLFIEKFSIENSRKKRLERVSDSLVTSVVEGLTSTNVDYRVKNLRAAQISVQEAINLVAVIMGDHTSQKQDQEKVTARLSSLSRLIKKEIEWSKAH